MQEYRLQNMKQTSLLTDEEIKKKYYSQSQTMCSTKYGE